MRLFLRCRFIGKFVFWSGIIVDFGLIKNLVIANWTMFLPFITGLTGAIIGVIGNQTYQKKFRKEDEIKKNLQLLNSFRGKLGVLIDGIDIALIVDTTRGHNEPIELQKDRAIRNFKRHFSVFPVYAENISKLLESEEHFWGKNNFVLIKEVNNILGHLSVRVHQIYEYSESDIDTLIYNNNITIFNEIKKFRDQLESILNQLL